MFYIDGFYAYNSFGNTIEKEGMCSINRAVDWSVSGVADYIDMLVQIIYAKFKNDRAKDNGF